MRPKDGVLLGSQDIVSPEAILKSRELSLTLPLALLYGAHLEHTSLFGDKYNRTAFAVPFLLKRLGSVVRGLGLNRFKKI